jgi:cytochrome c oxidase cbb3-type subunit I/II
MPAYPWLLQTPVDFDGAGPRVAAMATLGVPYSDQVQQHAAALARTQAGEVFARLVAEDPTYATSGLQDKNVVALVAYLLRLGTDISKTSPTDVAEGGMGSTGGRNGGQ